MNPQLYAMLPFVMFGCVLFVVGMWSVRKIQKEEAAKRAAGFTSSPRNSQSHSGE
jgi:hypothetical protein